MGDKINNKQEYPLIKPKGKDYFPLTRELDGVTRNAELSEISDFFGSGFKTLTATLNNESTFQNNFLQGASEVIVYVGGLEADGAGLLQGFDSNNGQITFTSNQSGKIKILYV